MTNPYATPTAQLEQQTLDIEGQSSLEGGISGQYDFSITAIIAEGWEKTSGAKGAILLAFLAYIVIATIVSVVQKLIFPDPNLLFQHHQLGAGFFWLAITMLVSIPITYPLVAGIIVLGIRRSVDAEIDAGSVFRAYAKVIPLTLLGIVLTLLIMLGYVLLIIPGIYLSVAYLMSMALMMDRNMGVWEALETSRKAISKHWFKVFFLYLAMGIMFLLACLPIFIGLIWMLPLLAIVQGLLYKKMFGVASVQ
ncbi:MAG: DUF975 family protein [Sulfuriferula sp.]